jgi:hypothetical protein
LDEALVEYDATVNVMSTYAPSGVWLFTLGIPGAGGRVYKALVVAVRSPVPLGLTEETVNVYCVPAVSPVNVYDEGFVLGVFCVVVAGELTIE